MTCGGSLGNDRAPAYRWGVLDGPFALALFLGWHLVIAIGGGDGDTATFSLPESALPPETLDVIDSLMQQGG